MLSCRLHTSSHQNAEQPTNWSQEAEEANRNLKHSNTKLFRVSNEIEMAHITMIIAIQAATITKIMQKFEL